jgi:hypothetical protein
MERVVPDGGDREVGDVVPHPDRLKPALRAEAIRGGARRTQGDPVLFVVQPLGCWGGAGRYRPSPGQAEGKRQKGSLRSENRKK